MVHAVDGLPRQAHAADAGFARPELLKALEDRLAARVRTRCGLSWQWMGWTGCVRAHMHVGMPPLFGWLDCAICSSPLSASMAARVRCSSAVISSLLERCGLLIAAPRGLAPVLRWVSVFRG